jgi:hypothetical protein
MLSRSGGDTKTGFIYGFTTAVALMFVWAYFGRHVSIVL